MRSQLHTLPVAATAGFVRVESRCATAQPPDACRTSFFVWGAYWSRDERTLLRGSYHPLAPSLERLGTDQLVLEYATERAGDLLYFGGKELGLGVVNPRIDAVERPADIRAAVEQAARLYPAERLFLNPDCGFGTFSSRPMNSDAIALAKVRAMAQAARELRG